MTNLQNGTSYTVDAIKGVVEATNPKGIKVQGQWLNFSKYDQVPRPERGQVVEVQAKGGYIKTLTIVSGMGTGDQSHADRQAVITRLAVLKAAAEFLAPRADVKSADVLRVAQSWETWVTR